jgi:hypothetical protein
VAIWRDMRRHRLVVAFRGTEQTKLKDLMTDLNVIPVGPCFSFLAGSDLIRSEEVAIIRKKQW